MHWAWRFIVIAVSSDPSIDDEGSAQSAADSVEGAPRGLCSRYGQTVAFAAERPAAARQGQAERHSVWRPVAIALLPVPARVEESRLVRETYRSNTALPLFTASSALVSHGCRCRRALCVSKAARHRRG